MIHDIKPFLQVHERQLPFMLPLTILGLQVTAVFNKTKAFVVQGGEFKLWSHQKEESLLFSYRINAKTFNPVETLINDHRVWGDVFFSDSSLLTLTVFNGLFCVNGKRDNVVITQQWQVAMMQPERNMTICFKMPSCSHEQEMEEQHLILNWFCSWYHLWLYAYLLNMSQEYWGQYDSLWNYICPKFHAVLFVVLQPYGHKTNIYIVPRDRRMAKNISLRSVNMEMTICFWNSTCVRDSSVF